MPHHGPQKAACEVEVSRVFGERALRVRPGLIVGPGDRSGRFSHWPWRVMAGGEMLVPDMPAHEPIQFIDVRDLAEWLVALLEQGASGAVDATGPAGAVGTERCDWQTLLTTCARQAAARGIAPATPVSVSEIFLIEKQAQPWSELPLWLPSTDPDFRGFNRVDLGRVRAAGLRTRPLGETVAAVMDEAVPQAMDARRTGKPTRKREAALLQKRSKPA